MIVLGVLACTPDNDYSTAFRDYVGIAYATVPDEALEDGGSITIPFVYGNRPTSDKAYTVHYTVTGGQYGADYTIDGASGPSGTLTIPAGQSGKVALGSIKLKSIPDFEVEDDVELTVKIESIDGGAAVGAPFASEITVVFADDDCAYDIADYVGDAASVENYKDGSKYPADGSTYATPFSKVSATELQMSNFWDSGMAVNLTLDGPTHAITVVNRTWNQLGFDWTIEGTGVINTCGKSFKVTYHLTSPNYSGGYDDTFDITYQFEK